MVHNFKELRQQFENELLVNVVPFWLKNGIDTVNGGLYNCLDREGKIYSTDKSVWMQGRCGYMFARLCNLYGKRNEWLELSKSCIDFLNEHCIDSDGRMYFTVTADGRPLRKRRYFFSETFYIMANVEYYGATGDVECLNNARKCYDFVYGIYKDPSTDPYKITPKTYSETRNAKALAGPMILLNVTATMRNHDKERLAYYDEISEKLLADIKCFNKEGTDFMLENVGINNEYISESSGMRVINPGHTIELSWFLIDEAEYRNDKELFDFAERIFINAYNFGKDDKYGGVLYFKDLEGKPVEAYEHDMKLWWVHNETMIAALKLYKATKKEEYFDIFKEISDYSYENFSDPEYGEWYGYLRRDGMPTEPPCKGHTYKGPFHVLRMLATCERLLSELAGE